MFAVIAKSEAGANPISWWSKISFAVDCARALVYLHHKGIIHRDLKSDNLLLTENKRIKVCDFGFSRIEPTTNEEKKRLSYCGTDAYMSPEIMLCIPFDTAVDIFSFGIILLELILGIVADTTTDPARPQVHPLFVRVIPGFGVNEDIITEAAPSDCPPAFLQLALNCALDDPTKRPSMRDILKQLRAIELDLNLERQTRNIGILTGSSPKTNPNRIGSETRHTPINIHKPRRITTRFPCKNKQPRK